MTGGLGPTKDDITKKTLAEYFQCGFKTDQQTLDRVKELLQRRGISATDINYMQAEVPEVCEVIQNYNGTAPCMVFRKERKLLVSMPGVPFEMKGLMEDAVLNLLIKESGTQAIVHKTIMTTGVPESVLAKRKFISIFRQKEAPVRHDTDIRINIMNPLLHHICLVFSYGLSGCNYLPV